MGNVTHMAGVGFEVEKAKSIVGTVETGVTATGSSQSDAYTIKAGATVFSTVAASTGAVLPASLPDGSELRVYNAGANNLSLYPPTGGSINDESANVAVIVPSGEGALISRLSNTVFGCVGCSDLTATELEYLDGVTAGTVTASKAVVVDSNKDVGDFRNLDAVNIDAGASGTAGTVDVFPTTASKGKFILSCTDQDGDTNVTLKPAAMGQASVVSIPDPGAATANAMLTSAANDGAVVASTSVEIDSKCDRSAQTVSLTATDAITQAEHEGRVNIITGTAAATYTLPEATGSGDRYKFIMAEVNTNGTVFVTADTTNCDIRGSLNILDADSNAQTAYPGNASDDTITLNGTTTGGQIGDWIEFVDIATDVWHVMGQLVCPTGSNVADMFSSAA